MDLIFRDDLNQLSRKRSGEYFFRADSAYCNQDVVKKCIEKGLFFTLTANDATTRWKTQLEETGVDWQPWEYSKEDIAKAMKRGRDLPKIEVGRMHWQPSWSKETLLFPIVMKRTWKTPKTENIQGDIFAPDTIKEMDAWEYYAVVTNFDLTKNSLQQVLEHHAKRGNSENFTKEEKYGFQLDGLPCAKLLANQAWMMLAMIGHNMICWIALMDAPDKPHYSKKIRSKYLFVAGRLVSHAGSLILRVMRSTYERGLQNLREGWQFPKTMAAQTALVPSG